MFSAAVVLVPSLPRVLLVDPTSSPNDKPVSVVAYVEFFSGPLFAVEALLDGSSFPPASFRAEFVSESITAFYFTLPRALSAGSHFVSFWSGDVSKALSFLYTAVDALQPAMIRMQPLQASTAGGDAVLISVANFNFGQGSSLLLGSTSFMSVGFYCQSDPQVCTINAISSPTQTRAFSVYFWLLVHHRLYCLSCSLQCSLFRGCCWRWGSVFPVLTAQLQSFWKPVCF